MQHIPVLLEESVSLLNIQPDGIYLDGTFGRGGHSKKILSQLNDKGRLLAIDKDPQAISYAKKTITDKRFKIFHHDFAHLSKLKLPKINGALFDFGVCSTHFDDPKRGFSLNKDGPLDMRMNNLEGISAEKWINETPEEDMANIFFKYGEEKQSRKIAKLISIYRSEQRIESTLQLANLISSSIKSKSRIHPATKIFQAIRIEVNQEISAIEMMLDALDKILLPGARVAIISFHSLEDRIIKNYYSPKTFSYPKEIPINNTIDESYRAVEKKLRAKPEEVKANPRSRSAVLRVYVKN